WNRFSDYYDSGFFHRYHSQHLGDIQYKVFWYAFELAWQWQLTEKLDFNFGFTPGIPLAMSFSAGLTYWPHRFEKKIEQPKVHLGRRKNPPVSAN
ncbi:MAG TPA: hypothetical protein VFU15_12390, partial [Bacteroidia bacterium]|nr:hypothetical protein [Bacteroidia bacterium]